MRKCRCSDETAVFTREEETANAKAAGMIFGRAIQRRSTLDGLHLNHQIESKLVSLFSMNGMERGVDYDIRISPKSGSCRFHTLTFN